MNANLIFIHALTSLHPGTGQGVGVIDLPVAREVATGIPYLPGSSLKGVLREACSDQAVRDYAFGPEVGSITNSNARAGAAMFSDSRVLLFPVRSLAGTFAWATSPFVLRRFQRDCRNLGLQPPTQIINGELGKARIVKDKSMIRVAGQGQTSTIYLEDLDLEPVPAKDARLWATWLKKLLFSDETDWQEMLEAHFCIVHDDVFSFLLDTVTEVVARNKLSNLKASENLWYIESLPAESILYGMVAAQQIDNGMPPAETLAKVGELLTEMMQLGGNAGVGRGLCRLVTTDPATAPVGNDDPAVSEPQE